MEKKVLVIDDDEIILECVALMLEAEGFEVVGARSGRSGVELSREHRPDIVLSDLHMPDFDGLDVFDALREDPRTAQIPFVVITADTTSTARQRCQEKGADAFVLKPFDPDDLASTVRQLTGTT